ncbi:DUF7882 family protein [Amnibacterium setariae]|uniref:DUF7882 family protein n=1 Tax=Amnibacterium setariae TaxID=2306585 RepID=UPI0018F2EE9F|nr:ATP-dependent DNA ligase [Amnibacterium setariae]
MGTLTYVGATVEFDDRTLTHLQVVIMQKFRRGESFPMSWADSPAIGDGRSAMWLTPTTPIFFTFAGSRVPVIDQEWIDRLSRSAESPRGLIVTDVEGVLVKAVGASRRPAAAHRVLN